LELFLRVIEFAWKWEEARFPWIRLVTFQTDKLPEAGNDNRWIS
jgi:hypothetical protein